MHTKGMRWISFFIVISAMCSSSIQKKMIAEPPGLIVARGWSANWYLDQHGYPDLIPKGKCWTSELKYFAGCMSNELNISTAD